MNDKARGRIQGTISLTLVLVGLWAAWSGPFTLHHPLLAVFGIVSIVLVVFLCRRMGLIDVEMTPLHLTPRTLRYIPWLTWQVITSATRVLRRALAPGGPVIQPNTLRLDAGQRTDLGIVTYANSITLTPGTLSLDSDADEHTITVFALSRNGAAKLVEGEMDRRVTRVEGVVEGAGDDRIEEG